MDNTNSDFNVLVIDGGGMRGLYAASFLAGLERSLGSITENFDLICGTSTGGLIALCLGAGKSAQEVSDFYENHGDRIFDQRAFASITRLTRLLYKKHQYSEQGLSEALKEVFGDKKIEESRIRLCIPTVNFTTCKPWVFKTDHDKTLNRDGSVLMRDIALATSAAPLFFPVARAYIPVHKTHHRFVDGGLWANSPVLVGLTEALRFFAGFGKSYSGIKILSISLPAPGVGNSDGCGYAPLIWSPARGVLPLVSQLLDLSMTSQVESAHRMTEQIGASLPIDFHLERIMPRPISKEQARILKLDGATQPAIKTMLQLGWQMAEEKKMEDPIRAFFSRRKSTESV